MTTQTLNRSDLITLLIDKNKLTPVIAEQVVVTILDEMSKALINGDRIEIRGFGSFEARQRALRREYQAAACARDSLGGTETRG